MQPVDPLAIDDWFLQKHEGRNQHANQRAYVDYVINLLEDANDFSWASAKASHAVLLCRMEQREVVGWSDVEKIDRIHRAHVQRHISQQSTQGKTHEKNGKQPTKFVACVYFNKKKCSQTKYHETKGVYYRHICAAC